MFGLFDKLLAAGSPAPPFLLPDQNGEVFVLNLHRNKNVILVFYPGDDTSVCTAQLCELRDNWDRVRERGGYVVGINPADASSHLAFRKKYNFPFPILVDQGKRVSKLYGCGGPIVKRTVYVIDHEGKIAFAQRGKPSVDEILAALPVEV